jgi:hypothetical protein
MIGCLTGLFVWPFRFIRWCFRNGWKGIIALVAAIIIIIVGYVVIHNAVFPTPTEQTQQQTGIPKAKEAPFIVQTSTRMYYAFQATTAKDGTVTMIVYWENIKNKWTKNPGTLVLDKFYGTVKIYKR